MASITWTCVFGFLVVELITTFILVVPVPRRIRNMIARKINRFHLGENFGKAMWFITIGLVLALAESYHSTIYLMEKLRQLQEDDTDEDISVSHLSLTDDEGANEDFSCAINSRDPCRSSR